MSGGSIRRYVTFSSKGGGVGNYGGSVTLTNSTISGNSGLFSGGVANFEGALTVTHSTISGNFAY